MVLSMNKYVYLPTIHVAQNIGNGLPPIFRKLSVWLVHRVDTTLVKVNGPRCAGQSHWAPGVSFHSRGR